MNRFLIALVAAFAIPAAATQTGTAQTQATMFDAFCDQCGPPKAADMRNLVASILFGTGGSVTQAITGTTLTATTKFLAPDGSNSAPTFAFTSAATNGIYYGGSNIVRFATGGVATHAWDSATYYFQADGAQIFMGSANDTVIARAAAGRVKFSETGANIGAQITATQTTVPTCTTNCGTGSPTVAGTDTAGLITLGTTPASAFQVNFASTWTTAPVCIVQPALASMVVGKLPIAVVTTATTMTVTTNGVAPATSDQYQYICIGRA